MKRYFQTPGKKERREGGKEREAGRVEGRKEEREGRKARKKERNSVSNDVRLYVKNLLMLLLELEKAMGLDKD